MPNSMCLKSVAVVLTLSAISLAATPNKQPVPASNVVSSHDPNIFIYKVNKSVTDFPQEEDFSTPESAFAAILRVWAKGSPSEDLARVTIEAHRAHLIELKVHYPVSPKEAEAYNNAKITEVWQKGGGAVVMAKRPNWGGLFDYDYLQLEKGKWLAAGRRGSGKFNDVRQKAEDILSRPDHMPRPEPNIEPNSLDLPKAGSGQNDTARHFVRLVLDENKKRGTLEGEEVNEINFVTLVMKKVPAVEKVPDRAHTVLEIAYAPGTAQDRDSFTWRGIVQCRYGLKIMYGFGYINFIGERPLGSKSDPADRYFMKKPVSDPNKQPTEANSIEVEERPAAQYASDPCAKEIIRKMQARYLDMQTYSASGEIISVMDMSDVNMPDAPSGKHLKPMKDYKSTHTFTIKLGRPSLYLIKWEQKVHPAFNSSGSVWNAGEGDYLLLVGKKNKQQSTEMALAGATGVSGGAAATIPSLFFNRPWGNISDMQGISQAGEEEIDGDDCYVVLGELENMKDKLWISKKTFLLRQNQRIFSGEKIKSPPSLSDEEIKTSLKALGKNTSPEEVAKMRDTIQSANRIASKVKGSSTEIYRNIKINEVIPNEKFVPDINTPDPNSLPTDNQSKIGNPKLVPAPERGSKIE